MQIWRFLLPSAWPFTVRAIREGVVDWATGAPPLPLRVRDYVAEHATEGDPADVLRTMDRFAKEERFLMNIGPDKGPLVRELVERLPPEARVLELGAFCGYSSILWATALGEGGRVLSIEKSRAAAEASRANVAHAGLSHRVETVLGGSTDMIPTLEGTFDLVFLDHWKDLYKGDLELIEKHGLIRPGAIVAADNVGEVFGAGAYLDYVRGCGRYDSENRPATIEYTSVPDAVEISVFKGAAEATSTAARQDA